MIQLQMVRRLDTNYKGSTMSKRIIQPGQKYGAVTVEVFDISKEKWKCLCECGNTTFKAAPLLLRAKVPSCGCKHGLGRLYPSNLSLKRQIITTYKTNANKKGINFDLTEDQVYSLVFKNCTYCGTGLYSRVTTRKRAGRKNHPERKNSISYNGIDRVDNAKGYTLENCVPCCVDCNISKNNLGIEQWKDWIKKVYSRMFND